MISRSLRDREEHLATNETKLPEIAWALNIMRNYLYGVNHLNIYTEYYSVLFYEVKTEKQKFNFGKTSWRVLTLIFNINQGMRNMSLMRFLDSVALEIKSYCMKAKKLYQAYHSTI